MVFSLPDAVVSRRGGTSRRSLFLCQYVKKDREEQTLPVVQYLLAQGADIKIETSLSRTPKQIVLERGRHMVLQPLTSHEIVYEPLQRVEPSRQQAAARELTKAELFAAKQREADEAANAFLRMEAEEVLRAGSNDKKSKGAKAARRRSVVAVRKGRLKPTGRRSWSWRRMTAARKARRRIAFMC